MGWWKGGRGTIAAAGSGDLGGQMDVRSVRVAFFHEFGFSRVFRRLVLFVVRGCGRP